jgi:hypothetical protein
MNEPGRLIGEGRMASIYACPDGRALKLFRAGLSRGVAEYDAERGRLIYGTSLNEPAVYESVTIGDQHGYYLELIDGSSVTQVFNKQPWRLASLSRTIAEAHADIHRHTVTGLTSFHDIFNRQCASAALPTDLKTTALAAVNRLPKANRLLHGDFHPDNILLTSTRTVVIDWANACIGHPLADVARTMIIARVGGLPRQGFSRLTIRLIRHLFIRLYLSRYRQLNPFSPSELNAWLFPLAVQRLLEDIPGERELLFAIIRSP